MRTGPRPDVLTADTGGPLESATVTGCQRGGNVRGSARRGHRESNACPRRDKARPRRDRTCPRRDGPAPGTPIFAHRPGNRYCGGRPLCCRGIGARYGSGGGPARGGKNVRGVKVELPDEPRETCRMHSSQGSTSSYPTRRDGALPDGNLTSSRNPEAARPCWRHPPCDRCGAGAPSRYRARS